MSVETVSILLASYNNAAYLSKCLNSLTSQTYKYLEIICVDDASTDDSFSILNTFRKKDERIKIIHSSVNQGLGWTRQKGIKAATGKYVIFVDADDEITPWTVEHALSKFDPTIDVVWYGMNIIYEANEDLRKNDEAYYSIKRPGIGFIYPKNLLNYDVSFCNKMFRRDSLLEIFNDGFGITERFFEDASFFMKFFASRRKVYFLDEKNYRYYRRPKSIMATTFNQSHDVAIHHLRILDSIYDYWQKKKILSTELIAFQNIFAEYFWFAYRHSSVIEKETVVKEAMERIDRWFNNRSEHPLLQDIATGKLLQVTVINDRSIKRKLRAIPKLKGLQRLFALRDENGHLVCRIGTVKVFSRKN